METKFKKISQAFQVLKAGKTGDFALLKADIVGAKVNPEVADKMRSLVGYHPPIDLEKLLLYPKGSFGREYAYHMRLNNLKPLVISPELEDVAKRNVFTLRYIVTHDIFHVLLGFDTSYAGEIGVIAFAAEQNYSKSLKVSLNFAKGLYPILAFRQIKAIFANIQKGQELGKKAKFLLNYRFEEHWEEPLNELRAKLGLPQIPLNQELAEVEIMQV